MKDQYPDIMQNALNTLGEAEIYPNGHEPGQLVLVLESVKAVKKYNEFFQKELKKNNIDTYPDLSHDDFYIGLATGDCFWFADETELCHRCGTAFRRDYDYGIPRVWRNYEAGEAVCEDCLRKDIDEYIDYLINNPHRANQFLTEVELNKFGFFKYNEDCYANGLHPGETDSPDLIFTKIKAEKPDAEIIFNKHNTGNPYTIEFDAFVRERE